MKPVVFFDTETTGLDVYTERIVELYMRKVDVQTGNVLGEYHQFFNPGRPIPQEAVNVHHITDEDVKDCPRFAEKAQEVADFIKDCYICGHNSNKYDVLLLSEELGRARVAFKFDKSLLLDTYQVERQLMSHSLIATYKRYKGKDYSETIGDAHGAKADTLATIEVFNEQMSRIEHTEEQIGEQFRKAGNPNDNEIDLAGNLVKNADGVPCYNFGKNKGRPVKSDTGYAMWMLQSNFPTDTKLCLQQILSDR
jgi:DNA polymerase-3 subunit epsilon